MIVCHRHRFLYVHIAKTGGTSIRAALRRLQWRDPMYLLQFLTSRLSHATGHRLGCKFPRHAKIIAAQEMLPHAYFSGLFKFAIVRNPWDLQVSSFHHLKRERPHLLEGHDEFESFLRWKADPERPYQYHLDTVMTPQTDALIDLRGKLLTDFLGRFERLEDDFAEICRRIGVPVRELPHKRKATDRERDYRCYYNDATAELVARHFQRDIELLDYAF